MNFAMKDRPASKLYRTTFLFPDLIDQLKPKAHLLLLDARIPREKLEAELSQFYAEPDKPAKSVFSGLLRHENITVTSPPLVYELHRHS